MIDLGSLVAVGLLSLVHVFVGRPRALWRHPRSAWLSAAGGAAAAYVFVYLLPKLAAKQAILMAATDGGIYGFLEHHAYLVALAGFLCYYGVGRAGAEAEVPASAKDLVKYVAFDLYVVGFAAYNVLIGYLFVHRQGPGPVPLLLVTVAMALHLLSSSHSLREKSPLVYDGIVRWLLAASCFAGWGLGMLTKMADTTVALWFAFLAGCIIINVIEEELPSERHSRFLPFLLGAAGYTGLVLLGELFGAKLG